MRKTLVIAAREYLAAVHTKTFLISLLVMPMLMGGSILVQVLLRNVRDTEEKRFAVIDRTPNKDLVRLIEEAVKRHNATQIFDPETGKQVKPRLAIERVEPKPTVDEQRLELSERVRAGDLFGFLDIGPDIFQSDEQGERASARYQSNRPTFQDFSQLAFKVITGEVQRRRAEAVTETTVTPEDMQRIKAPVATEAKGLTKRDPETGKIEDATESSRFAPIAVPFGLVLLMFLVVMMGATPLMQGVVEEKMQRIAEVLLGSVSPFQMMLGKLIGMAGVSMTIVAVYLGGGYWAARHYGFTEYVPLTLLLWFFLFQTLSALMYGSLFIAIGAACTDMKETQNLLLPVMLLACLPMFVLGSVLQEPNGPVAAGMSFFPFATPMLMIARLAIPPGIAWWQPVLGALLVLATTIFCVWAAGRIFRVGILMQGKGARLSELFRWVLRG